VNSLKAAETPQQAARLLWTVVCSREPAEAETQVVVDWFARVPQRQDSDVQALLWAVLAGAEFRFNH
jgi:hypothetical protein